MEYRPKYPESPFIHVADIVDPSTGKTSREMNMAKQHSIPVGELVEILPGEGDDRWDGVRLYVVHHHRDCDGTPLYAMAFNRYDTKQEDRRFHNQTWLHGFSEESIKPVKDVS